MNSSTSGNSSSNLNMTLTMGGGGPSNDYSLWIILVAFFSLISILIACIKKRCNPRFERGGGRVAIDLNRGRLTIDLNVSGGNENNPGNGSGGGHGNDSPGAEGNPEGEQEGDPEDSPSCMLTCRFVSNTGGRRDRDQ